MNEINLFNNKCFNGLNFVKKVYQIWVNINTDRKYIRDKDTKKIKEELMPLAKFIQTCYLPDMRVRWVAGNQPYDGILYFRGSKKFIEITSAMHKKDHLYRKFYVDNGHAWHFEDPSKPYVYSNNEHVLNALTWIKESIQKKKDKNYKEPRILIVQFFPDTCFLQEDYDELKDLLKGSKTEAFPEIFVVDGNTHHFFNL